MQEDKKLNNYNCFSADGLYTSGRNSKDSGFGISSDLYKNASGYGLRGVDHYAKQGTFPQVAKVLLMNH